MSDAMIDLRHRVLRFAELRRRRDAHAPLSEAETAELDAGIPPDEYVAIVEQIRAERRSAAPSAKATRGKAATARQTAAVADLSTFLTTENEPPVKRMTVLEKLMDDDARKKAGL